MRVVPKLVDAAVNVIVLLPVPLVGEAVSHVESLVTAQTQGLSLAVKAIEPLPPALVNEALVGEIE